MKRFVVLLGNTATQSQHRAFKDFVSQGGIGYWHWLSHAWLLTTDDVPLFSAPWVRDKVEEFYPSIRCLVLELNKDGDTWSGFGPKGENKNMFTWMHKNWITKSRIQGAPPSEDT